MSAMELAQLLSWRLETQVELKGVHQTDQVAMLRVTIPAGPAECHGYFLGPGGPALSVTLRLIETE